MEPSNQVNAPYLTDTCGECGGSGRKLDVDFDTMEEFEINCPECRGSGEVNYNPYDKLDKQITKLELYED